MAVEIVPLRQIDAVFEQREWDFALSHREIIASHWEKLVLEKPRMFNGKVLMQHRWSLVDGVYRTAYAPVDFASFLAWQQLGKPGTARRNGFAMAALRSDDGAFLLGVMGAAGKTYFAGGTPDMSDVTADGRVDLAGSMVRELSEETGLLPSEVTIEDRWVLALDSHRAAFLKPARTIYTAIAARAVMLDRIQTMADQELADIAIVRSVADLDEKRMPLFAVEYMRSVFANEPSA
jgi:8-oxo-dGTP pyrophosphatase MutT (NUDIX family)